MIGVDEVLRLDAWISAGAEEREREERAAKVREILVDGRSPVEIAEVERVIADARRRKSIDELIPPKPAAPIPITAPPTKRTSLYSPQRRGYMRATVEDGTRADLDAMQAEAAGSPFFDVLDDAPSSQPSSTSNAALADRLARLKSKKP